MTNQKVNDVMHVLCPWIQLVTDESSTLSDQSTFPCLLQAYWYFSEDGLARKQSMATTCLQIHKHVRIRMYV